MKKILFCLLTALLVLAACQENTTSENDDIVIWGNISGADSVTVTLSGDGSGTSFVEKRGGQYVFQVRKGGTYTVTASKTGYVFSPQSRTFASISSDQEQGFAAEPAVYTLSGTVTGADDVTVILSGSVSGIRTVKNGGSYSFDVPALGTYTVTPSKSGCLFTPPDKTFHDLDASRVQDFSAAQTYTISGTVTGADNVTVMLSGDDSGSRTVGNGGSYSFTVEAGGNYTVIPSKTGYTFTPSGASFTALSSDQVRNFAGSPVEFGMDYKNCQMYIHITTKVLYPDKTEYTEDRGGQFTAKGVFTNGVFNAVWDTTFVETNTSMRMTGNMTITVDTVTKIVKSFELNYSSALADKRYNSLNTEKIYAAGGGPGLQLKPYGAGLKGEVSGTDTGDYLTAYTEHEERSQSPNSNSDVIGLTPTSRNSFFISFW